MSTVERLLRRCSVLGILVVRRGDGIHVKGPARHLTDEVEAFIRRLKPDLLEILPDSRYDEVPWYQPPPGELCQYHDGPYAGFFYSQPPAERSFDHDD